MNLLCPKYAWAPSLDRLVCSCGILFLLAAQQNQHHASTYYPLAWQSGHLVNPL